uniref:Uncharacterized protein n=1 Tax=Oryza brachyantha TaxID=4533 RepID=J3N0R8_ORYBR
MQLKVPRLVVTRSINNCAKTFEWRKLVANLIDEIILSMCPAPEHVHDMVASVHGICKQLQLHQHPGVGDVSAVCLLDDRTDS